MREARGGEGKRGLSFLWGSREGKRGIGACGKAILWGKKTQGRQICWRSNNYEWERGGSRRAGRTANTLKEKALKRKAGKSTSEKSRQEFMEPRDRGAKMKKEIGGQRTGDEEKDLMAKAGGRDVFCKEKGFEAYGYSKKQTIKQVGRKKKELVAKGTRKKRPQMTHEKKKVLTFLHAS